MTTDVREQLSAKRVELEACKAKNASPEAIKELEDEVKKLEMTAAESRPRRRSSAFLDECAG